MTAMSHHAAVLTYVLTAPPATVGILFVYWRECLRPTRPTV